MSVLRRLFASVDALLRGKWTPGREVEGEDERGTDLRFRFLLLAGLLFGAVYGLFMGFYGALRPENPTSLQLLSSMLKVPLLFLLTLVVTLPSLYVFSALANSRLDFGGTLRLLLAGIVVNLTVLASFAPVTGFFTLSTESYPFMIVLNVVFFTAAGVVGVVFIWAELKQAFRLATEAVNAGVKPREAAEGGDTPPEGSSRSPPPLPRATGSAPTDLTRPVLLIWTIIYGAVGAQMGWILRPFVGSPDLPFQIFRERESNFFEALFRALARLIS